VARARRTPFAEAELATGLADEVRSVSSSLYGWEDLDPLMERMGDARYVLLGEASHGTAEFYRSAGHELPETFPTGV
jgi:erythromycin esterase-like protein